MVLGPGRRRADRTAPSRDLAALQQVEPHDEADVQAQAREGQDPREVSGRSEPDEPGDDEALPDLRDQPARWLSPDVRAASDLLRILFNAPPRGGAPWTELPVGEGSRRAG